MGLRRGSRPYRSRARPFGGPPRPDPEAASRPPPVPRPDEEPPGDALEQGRRASLRRVYGFMHTACGSEGSSVAPRIGQDTTSTQTQGEWPQGMHGSRCAGNDAPAPGLFDPPGTVQNPRSDELSNPRSLQCQSPDLHLDASGPRGHSSVREQRREVVLRSLVVLHLPSSGRCHVMSLNRGSRSSHI